MVLAFSQRISLLDDDENTLQGGVPNDVFKGTWVLHREAASNLKCGGQCSRKTVAWSIGYLPAFSCGFIAVAQDKGRQGEWVTRMHTDPDVRYINWADN
ncbi:MAG: hypothetical protein DRP64_03755 [Verrucomicrobia bacterium]|nr:MAG: hypothetical protein DRP64_03755 [Verrucomicrobiota bacterium]